MQRDWDIVRELLLAVEALEPGQTLPLRGFPRDRVDEINHHALLLHEAGLIDAGFFESLSEGASLNQISRLTWEGHEFLDTIKSDTVWNMARATIQEKTGSMTFEVVKALAVQISRTILEF